MKINKNIIVWFLSVLLFLVVLTVIVMCVCIYYPKNYPLHHIPVVNNLIDYYQNTEKKNDHILISLEQESMSQNIIREYCDRYNIDVLFQDIKKYLNKYQIISTTLYYTDYDYVIFIEKDILPVDFNKDIHRLISQAGDADLIISRNEVYPDNVNLDLFIVRNNSFSKYKLKQLFSIYEEQGNIPLDVILDQIYTNYKPKSFTNFDILDKGFPYLLSGICIYNGFAMANSHSSYFLNVSEQNKKSIYSIFYSNNYVLPELLNIKLQTIYPWKSIPGFTEISKNIENLPKDVYYKNSISPYIFQTMETTLLPESMYNNSAHEWMRMNPLYTYFYFDSLDCRKFIKDNFDARTYRAYDKLLPGAYKADLWRYCVLYKYGGVYVDSRTRPFVPLSDIVDKSDEFISPIDERDYAFWQGVLMCKPKHPFLKQTIDDICDIIEKNTYFFSGLEITGPIRLGKSINRFLKRPETTPFKEGIEIIDGYRIKGLVFFKTRPYITFNNNRLIINKFNLIIKNTLDEDKLNNILSGKEHYSDAHWNRRVYKKETEKKGEVQYFQHNNKVEITPVSYKYVYDNKKQLLNNITQLLIDLDIKFVISHGSLLEYTRGQPIYHDDNLDIRFDINDFDKWKTFCKSPINIDLYNLKFDFRINDINAHKYNGIQCRLIQFKNYKNIKEFKNIDIHCDLVANKVGSDFWIDYDIDFNNRRNVILYDTVTYAPSKDDTHRMLSRSYGKNYIIPDRKPAL